MSQESNKDDKNSDKKKKSKEVQITEMDIFYLIMRNSNTAGKIDMIENFVDLELQKIPRNVNNIVHCLAIIDKYARSLKTEADRDLKELTFKYTKTVRKMLRLR